MTTSTSSHVGIADGPPEVRPKPGSWKTSHPVVQDPGSNLLPFERKHPEPNPPADCLHDAGRRTSRATTRHQNHNYTLHTVSSYLLSHTRDTHFISHTHTHYLNRFDVVLNLRGVLGLFLRRPSSGAAFCLLTCFQPFFALKFRVFSFLAIRGKLTPDKISNYTEYKIWNSGYSTESYICSKISALANRGQRVYGAIVKAGKLPNLSLISLLNLDK